MYFWLSKMQIRFTADISGIKRNIGLLRTNMIVRSELTKELLESHRHFVEPAIFSRLFQNSQRDPKATPFSGNYKNIAKIAENIFSKSWRSGLYEINAGTGDEKYLDRNDPLLEASPPRPDQGRVAPNRLWRILEFGTGLMGMMKYGFIPIYPSRAPTLKFFWYRKKKWVSRKAVMHPGQKARSFFYDRKGKSQIRYESRQVGIRMKHIMSNIVKRYSG